VEPETVGTSVSNELRDERFTEVTEFKANSIDKALNGSHKSSEVFSTMLPYLGAKIWVKESPSCW
jgi:hypothetical protein